MHLHYKKLLSTLLMCVLLTGCEYKLFDPKGPIASLQMDLLIISALIMLIVVVPVTIMGVWFPYRYRQKNTTQEYKPDWEHSNKIELIVWTIPIIIIIILGVITYRTSYSMDPRKPIESDKPPIVVQVVAMDWKWLFIYPEYGIATVNEMAMPVDVPVEYLVTSDTVMNSFFIPNLGSQIYAMSGMENRVHLIASEVGTYSGFSGMKFNALATTQEDFDAWVEKVRSTSNPLDDEQLSFLREKQKDVKPIYYSSVNPLLFSDIIEKYAGAINGR